jgi:hypothetical protein
MKTSLLSFGILLFAAGSMNANVITCSNNAINAGMYTTIQAAHDAAAVGDTVYVMGSPTSYGDLTIKTRITLVGAGYALNGTQYNYSTTLGNIYFDTVGFGNAVSGTHLMGLWFQGTNQTGSGSINNITIERCFVNSTINVYGHNWNIRNNNVYYINVSNNAYIYIQNNFIGYVQYSNQPTVVLSNNDFVNYSGTLFYNISNMLIANNIFYYDNPTTGVTGSTFSNNITTASTAMVLPSAGNTGANNINNTPPGFTDATIPSSTVTQGSISGYNWTLKSTSPGHLKGTDNTDIGAYGGSYPMPNLTGATRIPQMQLFNVSGVVPQGGNLNVNFKARKQN